MAKKSKDKLQEHIMKIKNIVGISIVWILFIIGSYSWNYHIEISNTQSVVSNKAKSFFSQILITRAWNSSHGGVYVPVTEKTKPNPYLTDSLRDIVTTEGIKLTKINPAYMTRQIAEINKSQNDLQFHITSINPIRPGNKADAWETKALLSFENGTQDVLELVKNDSLSQYRYIAPLVTEKSCLKCHAFQGYKVGDIRGGISISFPSAIYTENQKRQLFHLFIAHLLILFAGLTGIYWYYRASNRFFTIIAQKNRELEADGNLLRQTNKDLIESLERNRATVTAMPDILFSLDHSGYFTNCQVSDTNFLLAPKGEIIGKSLGEILPREIAEKGINAISKAIQTGELQIIEYDLELPSGKKWFEMRIVNSSENEVLAISRDISERKTAEEEIRLKNEQLIIANTGKDRFMSIIGHDLKGPFSSILGLTQLLKENIRKYDIDKTELFVSQINKSAQSIYNLLEDILIWARSELGKIPFQPKELDFTEVCSEVVENLKLNAISKNITIHHPESEVITAYADLNMLKTILRNLISNALKFTNPGGQIYIWVTRNSSILTISVSDNGVGMEDETVNKLFDFSFSHSTKGTANESGTGLGLLLCKEFTEKHGGSIKVESSPGKGSCFSFTLPCLPESK
jgi:signal transduction histidine kinase